MAKILRKTQKIFCSNPNVVNQTAVFGTMTGTPSYSSDVETLQSNTAYEQGWNSAVTAGYAPFMEDMNTLQYIQTSQIAYLLQQGIAEWDDGTTYYTNSYCQVNGVLYKSLADNNLNNNPISSSGYWTSVLQDFLTNSQISNCIVEAPNGVATCSGTTVTAKTGLKVLIPNGLNTNGALNNTVYTINEDISGNISLYGSNVPTSIFITFSGTPITSVSLERWATQDIFIDYFPAPTTGRYFATYSTKNNIWYISSNGGNYTTSSRILIADFIDNGSQLSDFTTKNGMNLAKEQDLPGAWVNKYSVLVNGTASGATTYTYDLTNYLPIDEYKYNNYEVLLSVRGTSSTTQGNVIEYVGWSDIIDNQILLARAKTQTLPADASGSTIIPIGTSRKLYIRNNGAASYTGQGSFFVALLGFKKVRSV